MTSPEFHSRATTLLAATRELLELQKDSYYVKNLLEETVFYDGTDCDGYCLMDDIEALLEEEVPVAKSGEWEVVHGVFTPGGDPWLRCPFCKEKNTEHLGGIEMPMKWNYCPNCGAELKGDGHW